MIQEVFNVIAGIILMIVFHELGHIIVLRNYGVEHVAKFKMWEVGTEYDDAYLTKPQEKNMIVGGIISGIIPIALLSMVSPYYLFLAGLYIVGIKTDLGMLRGLK